MALRATSSPLLFIDVQAGRDAKRKTTEHDKKVRAFVMRDYLRHKDDPTLQFQPAKVSKSMISHVNRFRSASAAKRYKRKHEDTHAVQVRALRTIKPQQTNYEQVSEDELHTLKIPIWLPPTILLPFDRKSSEDSQLLEFYHTTYWVNSFALNPENQWLSVALSDKAITHALMALLALYLPFKKEHGYPEPFLKHRGEAIKAISERLGQTDKAQDDKTIAAVAILATTENNADWDHQIQESHIAGLETLVNLRGGIEALNTNRHIKRVIISADLHHAATHGSSPRVSPYQDYKWPTISHLNAMMPKGVSLQQKYARLDLPEKVNLIIRRMRLLAQVKVALMMRKMKNLCIEFAEMVCGLEYQATTLYSARGLVLAGHDRRTAGLTVICSIAALIFSHLTLRDRIINTPYEKLGKRLFFHMDILMQEIQRGFISDMTSSVAEEDKHWSRTEASFLLWVLFYGFKIAMPGSARSDMFIDYASKLSKEIGLEELYDLQQVLLDIVPVPERCKADVEDFWEAVRAREE